MKEICVQGPIRPMSELELLYEDIFCSAYGAEHREELIEKHRDKLPELADEHARSGLRINGQPIPFNSMWGIGADHERYLFNFALRDQEIQK